MTAMLEFIDFAMAEIAQQYLDAKSEVRFRAVTESAADAIVTADHRGVITYFNNSAEVMFRHLARDVVGKPLTILIPPRFREAHQRGLERFLATGEARVIGKRVELAGMTVDGKEFPIEISLTTWKEEGQPSFGAIIRDITERMKVKARFRGLLEPHPETLRMEKRNSEFGLATTIQSHNYRDID